MVIQCTEESLSNVIQRNKYCIFTTVAIVEHSLDIEDTKIPPKFILMGELYGVNNDFEAQIMLYVITFLMWYLYCFCF